MKFSSYEPAVRLNAMPQLHVTAPRDLNAYGGDGKAAGSWAAAFGQIAQVMEKRQEDMDSADELEARNRILSQLNKSLYGEGGLMRTGVGTGAKGLGERVGEELRKVSKEIGQSYNGRVQARLKQRLSDNMWDFQRLANSQEARETEAAEKANFDANVALYTENAQRFSSDAQFMGSMVESIEREIASYGRKHNWTGRQIEAAARRSVADAVGPAAQYALRQGDRTTAERIMKDYRLQMDPRMMAEIKGSMEKDRIDGLKRTLAADLLAKYRTEGGITDWKGFRRELEEYELPGAETGGAGADAVAKGFALWDGKTMDNKRVGCVEAVLNILGDGGVGFARKERENGVVNVDVLEQDAIAAGVPVIAFDEAAIQPGDIVIYDDNEHVLVYEGDGMVVGNSSSALDDVYGTGKGPGKVMRQNLYQGQTPTKIIRTGTASGRSAGRKLTPAEVDAFETYARHMAAQDEQDRRAVERAKTEALAGALEGAGSYQEAMEMIDGSGLPAGTRRSLEAAARRQFGISQGGGAAAGGSAGGGRTPLAKNPAEPLEVLYTNLRSKQRITTSVFLKAVAAGNMLEDSGMLSEEQTSELRAAYSDQDILSGLTDDVERHGLRGAFQGLMDGGMDPMVATILLSKVDPYYLSKEFQEEDREPEEDEE